MQCSLNFSEDKKPVLEFLKQTPFLGKKGLYELLRCKLGKSTLTLYKSGKLLIQGEDCEKVKERVLKALKGEEEAIVGIDEAGRGEGFGPFVVVGVLGKASSLRELRDSKKTRNLERALTLVEKNALGIAIVSFSSQELSSMHEAGKNLNEIEAKAISEISSFFGKHAGKASVVVDGRPLKGCKAGISFLVKGDDINPVIGAASVIAKSVRDKSDDKGKRLGWGSWGEKKSL